MKKEKVQELADGFPLAVFHVQLNDRFCFPAISPERRHGLKEKTGWVLGVFFTAWAALISAGLAFQKADDEKQNGLTDVFDLSPAESIFYVKHINGIPSLRSFSENT